MVFGGDKHSGEIVRKMRPARATTWILIVTATLFACHASRRLLEASKNQRYFYFHEGLATFSELVLYSVYLHGRSHTIRV